MGMFKLPEACAENWRVPGKPRNESVLRSHLGADRHGGRQGALGDLHGQGGRVDLMLRADDRRIFDQGHGDGVVQRFRQQLFDARRRLETLGLGPNHLPVIGDADLQQALSDVDIRTRLRERGFRLRHIGPRHLANLESVLRQAQLLAQHRDIALA